MFKKYLVILIIPFFFIGCATYSIDGYHSQAESVMIVKEKLGNKKISFEKFTGIGSGINEMMCRAAGPIKTPKGNTFTKFIEDSFNEEIKMAGNYDENSSIKINGLILILDFDSMSGTWEIKIKLTSSNEKEMILSENYSYSGGFLADSACRETAQAFAPAVHSLILKVFSSKSFNDLIKE